MLGHRLEELIDEQGWPCQRLRVGWSLILFYFFETLIGKQLPLVMTYLALGLGLALLGWATLAIREWKMTTQLALIQETLDRRPR